MAKDIIELLDHVGWTDARSVHIVGIIMGGMFAQELVSRARPGLAPSLPSVFSADRSPLSRARRASRSPNASAAST